MMNRLAPPLMRRVSSRLAAARGFATRRKTKFPPLAPEILDALPVYEQQQQEGDAEVVPEAFRSNPVSSAHCIDVEKQEVSTLDSAAVSPNGSVVHGRYGDLGQAARGIPLEYLALLRPASEGAAALRAVAGEGSGRRGTFLVYGATQANGYAAAMLANGAGHAVVAVVGGEHCWNDDMTEAVKGLVDEPGTAVPEEYALSKKNFMDLVDGVSKGNEGIEDNTPEEYLDDFKANFLDYVEAYPDTRPAAVSQEHLDFQYMEKDREFWEQNMEAYLSQFPPGAPPVDKAKLDAFFSTEQYEIFRQKFWKQTSGVISGDDTPFSPPHIVKKQSESPETLDHVTYPGAGPDFPYSFSVLNQFFPEDTGVKAGGPVIGAAIAVTPALRNAVEKVAAAPTLRAKGEALQFLTMSERAAYGAARSVAANAGRAGAPVVVMGGSLPGLESVEPSDADVKAAIAAMDIDEDGESRLNYFVQVYGANDFPFYATYAVHRASEPLAGPRQIIVTK